jgi:natural product precursor
MKKLSKLKLNAFREQDLEEKQMNALRGGRYCFGSCYYANNTGSSSNDNAYANYKLGSGDGLGGYSGNGCNQYRYSDSTGFAYCDTCNADNCPFNN